MQPRTFQRYGSENIESRERKRSWSSRRGRDYVGGNRSSIGIGEECPRNEGDFQDEGGEIEHRQLSGDRWSGRFHGLVNEAVADGVKELQTHDSNKSCHGKSVDDNRWMASSGGSQENNKNYLIQDEHQNHPADVKAKQTCYKCGEPGHKMRDCPKGTKGRRKLTGYDSRHDDEDNHRGGNLERCESASGDKMKSRRKDLLRRQPGDDVNSDSQGKHCSFGIECPSAHNKSNRFQEKDHVGNKRNRKKSQSPKRYKTKKTRSSDLSPLNSTPQSSKQVQNPPFHSQLRSMSSDANLFSSNSWSSTSHDSIYKNSKSRSRTCSPTSLFVPASHDQPLPPSSDAAQLNVKNSLDGVATPELKEFVMGQGERVNGATGLASSTTRSSNEVVVEAGTAIVPSEREKETESNDPQKMACNSSHEVRNPNMPLIQQKPLVIGIGSTKSMVTDKECQNSGAPIMECLPVSTEAPALQAVNPCSGSVTSISKEEFQMVLKHYGFHIKNESERNLPADEFFGTARLWPWEIIYYRRLKKGSISVKNYAKRIEQNREFGIVDKYIRSSSGWEEVGRV